VATKLKPCNCNCAGQISACDCGSACALDCRQKSGFATLCGFSEFTDPSDPPLKYRKVTNSGSLRNRIFQPSLDCDPATTIDDGTFNYEGDGVFDRLTCLVDCTGIVLGSCGDVNAPTGTTRHTTKTESKAVGDGCAISSGISSRSIEGTWTNTLSDQDTEADGIARAESSVPDWSACTDGGSAFITDRSGTGEFNYGFRHAQTRAMWTAEVGRTYNVRINFARRLLGSSGPFLDLGMPYETTLSADVIDEKTDWVDVPNEAGWETIASSCALELVP
jgi:hypothetical protein